MIDDLGDRMKLYEGMEGDKFFMPGLPIIARLDGRSFHNFTRGLPRPYSEELITCMIRVTAELVRQSNSAIGYHQSDEITLIFHPVKNKQEAWFGARIQKMCSALSSIATVTFYREIAKNLPREYVDKLPTFDCRVWQVPNKTEAINTLVWREWDATKNSITMAASSMFSHKELHLKHGHEKQEMMWQKGVNWNNYPAWFKRGSYIARRAKKTGFTPEELGKLPEKHQAKINPDLLVERHEIRVLDMPPINTVSNMIGVVFDFEEPILRSME